jgi:hypothetical protein
VALTTMATLMLELSLTRIFSVVFYYHFAFLAISIALFGLGAGGVFSYFFAATGKALYKRLGLLSAANAVMVGISLFLILDSAGHTGFRTLVTVYFAAALPFVIAGVVVSAAIAETIERVDRVYFFDLLGAAAACLLLIPFLNILGGPATVLAAAVLFAAAGGVWFALAKSVRGRAFGVALALLLVGVIIYNLRTQAIDVREAKGKALTEETFVQWNSFSRIALTKDKPGGSLLVSIDADATTGIPQFDLDNLTPEQRAELSRGGPSLPYLLRPGAKTLILGAGGGWDVARAIASGSKNVTGVEINSIIADTIMRRRFRDLSNGLYFRPEVRIVVEDGRSFVRRSEERYQVLQATLVDTWASTAAGAYALSENNLYTTDAFQDYFSKLTPDGLLAFTRWGFEPPRESLRLLSLSRAALARLGEREAWKHVIVFRENTHLVSGWGATDTVIISRKPLTSSDTARARYAAQDQGFDLVYSPGDTQGPFARYLRSTDPKSFYVDYPYDVSPVGDDRPFFFYTVQPRDIRAFLTQWTKGSADFKVNMAVPTLFGLIGISLVAMLVMVGLPPLVLRTRLPNQPGVRLFLLYFVCLGAGYILIQVSLIQKLVLFLGHPTYALTVVIFSMLVASGLGSYYSRRFVRAMDSRLQLTLALTAILVAVLAFAVSPLTNSLVGQPLTAKAVIAILIIFPPAFLMGMPFPSGLTRLEYWHKPSVRWAWSLNAAASVLGSAAAMILAVYLGLRNTMLAGAAAYLIAMWTVLATAKRAGRPV